MIDQISAWLVANWVQTTAAVLGIVYIFLSIKQNILTWPVGLLTSALYIYVFFVSKFYADMALQGYYVVVSFYGWYVWLKGDTQQQARLEVSRTPRHLWLWLLLATVGSFLLIEFVLQHYTDSPIPVGDAITTALSLVATWMLARKYIEHWLIWVFVDALSTGLYAFKGLWPTVVLFSVYTVMAVAGYWQWRKELNDVQVQPVKAAR
ncbi:nicotinamide riboside transporter PnuC [Mangrovibacterium marinum]|uniref:Nicotinamide riboside transporter PnuC n=1 Tax=Mangrovibacterium marinum TaxID=1639118 RepID=A0A2T5BZS4_9BACT|nr:nicotinamide riboside transporter PnuC [Mangrovibacterium marinum]PTN07806.1 nicotinamide mononucleotide transporter [Mangrovibacterium marinum]